MTDIPREGAETAPAAASQVGPVKGAKYALFVLLLAYICNFVDRNILSIVAQPMKEELGLADWELGLLGGLAFALFYVTMGLPIARLAERHNRVRIISVLLIAWSAMTAVCGLAQNFTQMLLARIGVGVGEAGCSPASHSLIADYFPRATRTTALSIYSIAIPAGPLIAGLVGGWLAHEYGWRYAFYVVAAPGILLSILVWVTMKEPIRGRFDPKPAENEKAPTFLGVLAHLARKPTFIHIAFGASLATFANYAISNFAVPYLLRGYPINIAEAGAAYGLLAGLSAVAGTVLGGWLVDKMGVRDRKMYVLIPAIGVIISGPLYVAVLLQTNLTIMAALVILPAIVHYLYLGPTFGMTANMAEARMRATASAIVLFFINLLGLGLGPLVAGILSDVFAQRMFEGAGSFLTVCPGGKAPVGSDAALATACQVASFKGLQMALIISSLFYVWAGFHYLLAARTVARDLGEIKA